MTLAINITEYVFLRDYVKKTIAVYLLMTEQENLYKGYWWFSDNPDNKSAGIASIGMHKGADVETIGSLISSGELFNKPLNFLSDKCLLGETSTGAVTLLGVVSGSHKFSSSTLSEGNYSADIAIVGPSHFHTRDDVIFSSVEVEFDLLNEWIGSSGITVEYDVDRDGCWQEARIKYRFPEVSEFYIEPIGAKIRTNYRCLPNMSFCDKRIRHNSSLVLTPDTPQQFSWYLQKIESLRRFLVVVTGYSLSVKKLIGIRDSTNEEHSRGEEFQIYMRRSEGFAKTPTVEPSETLTCLFRTKSDLGSMLNAWFGKTDILTPAITLYAATLSVALVYSEFRLVNYAQALETLDRGINADKKPSKKRMKRLLDGIWEDCMKEFIDDIDDFVDKAIATRNYAVHFNPYENEKDKIVYGNDIYYLAERLKVLLIANILLQLDLPREEVYQAILRFEPFCYLKQ